MELLAIFIAAVLINNFVLHYFLGICPFLGVSKRIHGAGRYFCHVYYCCSFLDD